VIEGLAGKWNKMVVAYVKVISRYILEVLRKPTKLIRITNPRAEILIWDLPNTNRRNNSTTTFQWQAVQSVSVTTMLVNEWVRAGGRRQLVIKNLISPLHASFA
jgi:hypothetical protein